MPDCGDVISAHEGWTYIPGAGDDAEYWAPHGFSPSAFWAHKSEIQQSQAFLSGEDADCEDLVAAIALRYKAMGIGSASADIAQSASAGSGADSDEEASDTDDASTMIAASLKRAFSLPSGTVSIYLPSAEEASSFLSPASVEEAAQALMFENDSISGEGRWAVITLAPLISSSAPAGEVDGDASTIAGLDNEFYSVAMTDDLASSSPIVENSREDGNEQSTTVPASLALHAAAPSATDPSPYFTTIAVPPDKQALRKADGGRAWQRAVFPAAEAFLRLLGASSLTDGAERGPLSTAASGHGLTRLVILPSTPQLQPHAVVVAAMVAASLQQLRMSASSGSPDSAAAAALSKSSLRLLLCRLMAACGVAAVPRELQQELNRWFLKGPEPPATADADS